MSTTADTSSVPPPNKNKSKADADRVASCGPSTTNNDKAVAVGPHIYGTKPLCH